jgi:3-hydroxyisobutyrate dehydrogenase
MSNTNERIGWIGLGSMGHPMAKNLEKAGFPLTVYNRTREKGADFTEKSTVAESIGALVQNSDVIFSILSNDKAVTEVYNDVLQANDLSGKLFIDMSTISQGASLVIAGKLKAKGASLIDAPVAGSTKPAADGTLIIMAGGDVKDVERAIPYFQKLSKLVKHLGENGKGIAAKLSINYFISILYQGLAETVLLSGKLGVDRKDMLEIINKSASGSGATKVKTPLLLEENYKPAFSLNLMLKDVLLAQGAGAHFPFTDVLVSTYKAAQDAGFGGDDVIGVINYLKDLDK